MKPANTTYPVHELIRNRWSPRSFSAQPIAPDTLNQLFEAASWAFSAMNAQPWQYIYAHKADTEAFQKILDTLMPGNQPWAKNAAVLIIALANTRHENGQPNGAAMHDLGAANATLFLEATALGIYGHVMGGFDREKVRRDFNLPEELAPAVVMGLGYLGPAEQLQEPFLSREAAPRARKPVAEFAFQHELPVTTTAQ
ncbi:nitroreductase family protein [Hymenobacter negativus]|uniref:Nitroreductase family protein n=1 Tax=Hymenobacter negativus TaxID=2795026 RepID=A0ABS3QDF0_9BACT|nr:nitroreductase family protein [Hymenobacter negativus]MBO2009241.1 nitroreductase family protein [Hymenobacter negativus]